MKPAVTIFSNQKGGVGKTTLARELGVYVSTAGFHVLLVDADPQGNLSKSLLPDESVASGLYDALEGSAVAVQEIADRLAILSGDFRLSALEKSLIGEIDAFGRLRELFASEPFRKYDHMRPALYSMQGTNDLMKTVAKVKKTINPGLNLLGVIINGFDSQPVIVREIRREIEESFADKVFATVLSQTIKLEEAIAERTGVIHLEHLAKSRAKEEVERIGAELLERLGGVSTESEARRGT